MEFDKWEELKRFLQSGVEYLELPEDQRKAYKLAYDKMLELEEIEKRFV